MTHALLDLARTLAVILATGEFMAIFFAKGERLIVVNCGGGVWTERWEAPDGR